MVNHEENHEPFWVQEKSKRWRGNDRFDFSDFLQCFACCNGWYDPGSKMVRFQA
jgi:hypothetical protein